jgi:putative membrane protein
MGIIPLLFLALLISAVVLLVRYAAGTGGRAPPAERRSPGLDALEERYARGEIDRDEYLQKKKDILG